MDKNPGCTACRDGKGLDFPISMAFQPIVNLATREIFAHEALVRGSAGESAGSVPGRLPPENLYPFDQSCRIKALEWAPDSARSSPADMPQTADPGDCRSHRKPGRTARLA
jgi:hypothetical protein